MVSQAGPGQPSLTANNGPSAPPGEYTYALPGRFQCSRALLRHVVGMCEEQRRCRLFLKDGITSGDGLGTYARDAWPKGPAWLCQLQRCLECLQNKLVVIIGSSAAARNDREACWFGDRHGQLVSCC